MKKSILLLTTCLLGGLMAASDGKLDGDLSRSRSLALETQRFEVLVKLADSSDEYRKVLAQICTLNSQIGLFSRHGLPLGDSCEKLSLLEAQRQKLIDVAVSDSIQK